MRHLLLILFALLATACANQSNLKLHTTEKPLEQLLQVEIPITLELQSVNGQEIENFGTLFRNKPQIVELLPGDYDLTVVYRDFFTINNDKHEKVTSPPILYQVSGQPGDLWKLATVEANTLEQAKALAADFKGFSLNTQTGATLPAIPQAARRSGFLSGLLSSENSSTEVQPKQPQTIAPKDDSLPVAAPIASGDSSPALQQVQALWPSLTLQQKMEFLEWVKTQP